MICPKCRQPADDFVSFEHGNTMTFCHNLTSERHPDKHTTEKTYQQFCTVEIDFKNPYSAGDIVDMYRDYIRQQRQESNWADGYFWRVVMSFVEYANAVETLARWNAKLDLFIPKGEWDTTTPDAPKNLWKEVKRYEQKLGI